MPVYRRGGRDRNGKGSDPKITNEELEQVGDLVMAGARDTEIAEWMGISKDMASHRIQLLYGIHDIHPGNRVRLALALYKKALLEPSKWEKGTPNAER